ncbi:SpaA isopeptide-forming pilin-related protein [Leucobacter sp. OH1287]|uniref:SpaA isopeptide-forming pilin-related protein n=1 Tax=Leucobacter sp. OH1287 TaxID=2491049 RepID=UPI000F5E5643|nr:SpaA isopeptide-forming pilin-related protein [Leucobacter sp. OH1287]RRD61107.1 hypothetical protein EII30_03105 [Leucobacter sp. OH1287]
MKPKLRAKSPLALAVNKFVVLVLATLVAVGGLLTVTPQTAQADPTQINLWLGDEESVYQEVTDPKTEYFSGETIKAAVRFEVSDASTLDERDPILRLEVLKQNPIDPSDPKTDDRFISDPDFIDPRVFGVTSVRGEDANKWWMEYHYSQLSGGSKFQYEFPFYFKNFVTPNGSTVPVTAKLMSANGTVLKEGAITFVARSASEYKAVKLGAADGQWRDDSYGPEVQGISGVPKFEHLQKHVEQWDQNQIDEYVTHTRPDQRVGYRICVTNVPLPNAAAGTGVFSPQTIKITETFPAGAKFAGGSGWQVAADGKSATWTLTSTPGKPIPYVVCPEINLLFSKLPISKDGNEVAEDGSNAVIFTNRAKVIIDEGLSSQQVKPEVKWDHFFRMLEQQTAFDPQYATTTAKHRSYGWYQLIMSDGKVASGSQIVADPSADRDFNKAGLHWWIEQSNFNSGSRYDASVPAYGGKIEEVTEIEDYDLDSRLYYNVVRIEAGFLQRNSSNHTRLTHKQQQERFIAAGPVLYGIAADGSESEIKRLTDVSDIGSDIWIEDTARKYSALKLKFINNPLELDNFGVRINFKAMPTAAEFAKWAKGDYSERQDYDNKARAQVQTIQYDIAQVVNADGTKTWQNGAKNVVEPFSTKVDDKDNIQHIQGIDPRVHAGSTQNHTVPWIACENHLPPGTVLTPENCGRIKPFTFSMYRNGNLWGVPAPTAKDVKGIVLLPPGVDYHSTVGGSVNGANVTAAELPQPRTVKNFQNTGRTAVVYDFAGEQQVANAMPAITLNLHTSQYAATGSNTVEFYWSWSNNNFGGIRSAGKLENPNLTWDAGAGAYRDAIDLDNDGDKNEFFLKTTNTITFVPPKETRIMKHISTDAENWSYEAPAQDLGSDLYYRITLENGDAVNLNKIYLLDVLPSLDDYTIVDGYTDASPNDLVYTPRWWEKLKDDGSTEIVNHSGYVTPLVMAIEDVPQNKTASGHKLVPNDYFVYKYSVTEQANSGDILASVLNSQWYTKDEFIAAFGNTQAAWAKVQSIRAEVKDGKAIPARSLVEIVTKHQIPFNDTTKALDSGTKSVNALAISANNTRYLETLHVRSEIVKYQVDGIAFHDVNENGNHDAGERLLAGYKAELINADGSPAMHQDGTPIAAVNTDSNGAYHFDVYKRGDYRVKFTKKPVDNFTKLGNGAENVANHVVDKAGDTGLTAVFTLSPTNRKALKNVGIFYSTVNLDIKKTGAGADLADVKFSLDWKGEFAGFPAPNPLPSFEGVTNATGMINFTNVPYGVYTLTEVEAPAQYVKTPPLEVTVAPTGVTIKDLSAHQNVSIDGKRISIDNRIAKGSVIAKKVDAADETVVLKGVTFSLTPKSGGAKIVAQTDASGIVRFDNVAFGEYTLKEDAPIAGYNPSEEVNGRDINIDADGKVIDLSAAPFKNAKITGTITVVKHDADDVNLLLPGVIFGLYRDGETVPLKTAKTGVDGVATFTGIEYGTYKVREITPLVNYLLTNWEGTATIQAEGQVVALGNVPNTMIRGNASLLKQDEDTKTPLAGVVFEVLKGNTPVAEAKSDATGLVIFENLPYGDYTVREKSTVVTHLLNQSWKADLQIRLHGATVDLGTVTNKIKTGDIALVKTGDHPAGPLAGAEFELRQGGNVVAKQTTGQDGKLVFKSVPYGDYEVVEVKAPEGYLLATDVHAVKVRDNGETINLGTLENKFIVGHITFKKVNPSDEALTGAIFELRDSDGNKVAEATSDDAGAVRFENVHYGKYIITETVAPNGYVLDTREIGAEVTEDGKEVKLENVVNQPEPKPILSVTGGNNLPLLGGGIAMMILGAGICYVSLARYRKQAQDS